MTIEFPEEETLDEVPAPPRGWRPGVLWALPTVLAVVALFLPVTSSVYSADPGGDGGLSVAFRVDTYPFGRVHVPQLGIDSSSGAPYGWLWLVVAVGFALAGGLALLRPATARPWAAAVGLVAGAAAIGVLTTSRTPAPDQSASANAGG